MKKRKKILLVLAVTNTLAFGFFLSGYLGNSDAEKIVRNTYGDGKKTESYEVTIEGELEKESIDIEVDERVYSEKETEEMFAAIMEQLDETILGDNKTFDHVDTDLYLPGSIGNYPVDIRWEFDSYQVIDAEGNIIPEKTVPEGTPVTVRGILNYGEREAVYTKEITVYPEVQKGKQKWLSLLQEAVEESNEASREDEIFSLPNEVAGKKVQWKPKSDRRGYVVLLLGAVVCALLVWNEKQEERDQKKKRREQMERDYPDILSRFVMLLDTGMTVKQVWERQVTQYEAGKAELGERAAYEEMKKTCHEMQSGITEAEAYERFGARCESAQYLKFAAMLSQNLRKGSRGLGNLLRMEAIQAFETRKSNAKRKGEEAGTKLLLPMLGMLAVVLIMVVVPAFLSMKI